MLLKVDSTTVINLMTCTLIEYDEFVIELTVPFLPDCAMEPEHMTVYPDHHGDGTYTISIKAWSPLYTRVLAWIEANLI